jgi:hypothetical protein
MRRLIDAQAFKELARQSQSLRVALFHHFEANMVHAQQMVACNAV